jgi:hypothetical protein
MSEKGIRHTLELGIESGGVGRLGDRLLERCHGVAVLCRRLDRAEG